MEKAELLYTRLKENIPFAFLKLNDGEIKGLKPDATGISRGAERSSELMALKLTEALNFRKNNYYIGLPCTRCQASYYTDAINIISHEGECDLSNVLSANVLINSNLDKTIDVLKEYMGEKRIVIVTNAKNSANITELEQLNIKPYKIIEVAEKYAFETDYERVKDEWKTLQNGDIVMCLCGPLGCVLCYEWYKANPQLTCLELGSMFDPLLQSRTYLYHTGNHQYCEECYPSQEATESSLIALCEGKTLNKECYYFYSWEDNENFYQHNYEKIKRNTEIRLEKETGNAKKIIQKCEQKINSTKEIDYRNNDKTQLFQLAEQFYNQRNLVALDKVCDLYVDYFGHMDSPQLDKILFYSSFANLDINYTKGIQRGELLYDKKGVADDLHFYTMCNLSNKYPKNQTPIPKVIHLLFFGETDFLNYHYECICAMMKNMPDYPIIIYNKKEPQNNPYWDKVKKKVTIEKIDVPEYFDGFKLNYFQYKADVVRLEILYEKGGIYLDIDMLIIKNFENIINTGKDLYISEEGGKGGGWINAFIAAKPKNEFLKICLENFKTGFRMENWAWHMRDGNRQLLEKHPHYSLKYNIEILESKYFFPFSWTEREKFIHIEDNLNEEIYGIHLFETILHDILWNNKYFAKLKETTDDGPQVKKLDLAITEIEDTHRPYDEILVLTLEEYPDRQEHMETILRKNKLEATLLIHKLHEEPRLGCLQAHMNAIKYAKKHNLKSVMIFEDDILINDSFKTIDTYPDNWDMLYLGGILTHHTEKKEEWVKGVIWCNHAYIVKDTLYDKILETYEGLDKEEMSQKGQTSDWLYTTFINPHYNCWLYEKQAIIQKEGFSLLDQKQKWGKDFDWNTWVPKYL